MKINFTGHQMELTTALKAVATEKLNHLDRYFDKATTLNITFHLEKQRHIIEATIPLSGNDIHAHAESDNMYSAIDEVVDKLHRQLTKHKEKIRHHRE